MPIMQPQPAAVPPPSLPRRRGRPRDEAARQRVLDAALALLRETSFADVTIFDPKKRWTFEAAKSRSLSRNTPFDGWQFTGKVVATIVGGKTVYLAD